MAEPMDTAPVAVPEVEWIGTGKTADGKTFSIVTYNILANCYIKEATTRHPLPTFPYVTPRSQLDFKVRAPRIVARLAVINADIVCLQEVERFTYWEVELLKLGYKGIFSPRPNDSRNVGVATFWKDNKFTARYETPVDLNKVGPTIWDAKSIEDFNSYKQNNSGLVVSLLHQEEIDASATLFKNLHQEGRLQLDNLPHQTQLRFVVVGNFHAHWDPKYPLVKLAQTKYMLETMFRGILQSQGKSTYVLAGDFNSLPDSQVYAALSRMEFMSHNSHELQRTLAANEQAIPPFYTNYTGTGPGTGDFNGTLDYIWYSDNLVPTKILKLDTEDQLKAQIGLPNFRQPSDHLPVAMHFVETSPVPARVDVVNLYG
jgi:CCR4-NOT transcription complex subunit 6